MKSLPGRSLPSVVPQRREPDRSTQSPPHCTGSHARPTPSPAFVSHLVSLCGVREGVAILSCLHPTLSRGKSIRAHQRQPQLAPKKLGQSELGASTTRPHWSLIRDLHVPFPSRSHLGPGWLWSPRCSSVGSRNVNWPAPCGFQAWDRGGSLRPSHCPRQTRAPG